MSLIDRRCDSQQVWILQSLRSYAVMRWARGKTAHGLPLLSELESLAETAPSTYPSGMNELVKYPRLHSFQTLRGVTDRCTRSVLLVYQIVERRFA